MVVLVEWLAAMGLTQAAPPPPQTAKPAPPPVDELVVTAPKANQEPAWANKLNLDPTGRHAAAKTPYWARPQGNGCRVTIAGPRCVKRF